MMKDQSSEFRPSKFRPQDCSLVTASAEIHLEAASRRSLYTMTARDERAVLAGWQSGSLAGRDRFYESFQGLAAYIVERNKGSLPAIGDNELWRASLNRQDMSSGRLLP